MSIKTSRVLVLIADGTSGGPDDYGMERAGVVLRSNTLPVSLDYHGIQHPHQVLGSAYLEWEGDRLYATFELVGAQPLEELKLLYPGIGGTCTGSDKERNVVTGVDIFHIGLHVGRNADHRILSLGDQGITLEILP